MQYTIDRIPMHLDSGLRERARRDGRSLEDVVIDVLLVAMGLSSESAKKRTLGDLAGTWREDTETERALVDQRADMARW